MAETPMEEMEPWERDVGFALEEPVTVWPRRPAPAREQPPNAGQPWTDAEYEEILAAAREGVTDMDHVATRLGRSRNPTLMKARRLLPPAERSAPPDRVMRMLREHLEEPDYDWERVTLEELPPRPVINPPALTGIAGVDREDLVRICYALALAGGVAGEDLMSRVTREVLKRGLTFALIELRVDRLLHLGAEVTWDEARADAGRWVNTVLSPVAPEWPYLEEEHVVPPYW
ncbi:hypothetical protein [Oceanitalea stevensii]|uniref:Uncharacterized protein n=1 Tax=Oceanitalea stevensii TaxID=2763072 RepID=A0ABR8YY48_9MICO|nr:hypothetical protein [Oceanitalea stevensii]MBD8060975.1 hypothetical protein [Oceanitalea stevensii]